MLLASDVAQPQWTCSRTRLTESGSRPESQANASGAAVLPEASVGNHFCATAAAASARAGDGSIPVTSGAAVAGSPAPLRTPATACARLLPVRFSSHQAHALAAS